MEIIEICNQEVHPAQEMGAGYKLENRDYLDCQFVGPVVFWLGYGVVEEECTFADGAENVLRLFEEPPLKGAIWLSKVSFVRCQFRNIGFVGPQESLDRFLWEPAVE